MNTNNIYNVEEVIQETSNVFTLKLSCESVLPTYRAGQFITVFFPETGHVEGKSYSISSAPHENHVRITVKRIGEFSKRLTSKKVGDTITASLPYGYFYSESETSSLVIITGGIGIAPFRSMILDSLTKNPQRKIVLLYANKTVESIIFKQEFDELAKKHEGIFTVQYYITQETAGENMKQGRIPIEHVIEASKNPPEAEFFICGSISFVRGYWKGLKDSGIKEETIYTEAFF
ncbi:MAG: FAD-binding oxidoreductase [Candidatus Paceibacterota bacterium]